MWDLIKGFILGSVVGAVAAFVVIEFAKTNDDPKTDDPPVEAGQVTLGEIKPLGNLVLASQRYTETCWLRDDARNLSWGEATFEWTQELGFGVSFKDAAPKLSLDENGSYTLHLPPLKQLHPKEHGFSRIFFPDTVVVAIYKKLDEKQPKNPIAATTLIAKVIADRYGDGKLNKHFLSAFKMPTAAELDRMRDKARAAADDRTDKIVRMILQLDAMLVGQNDLRAGEQKLSEFAGEEARKHFEPLLAASIESQIKATKGKLKVGDKDAVQLKSPLKVVFGEQPVFNDDPTYVKQRSCS